MTVILDIIHVVEYVWKAAHVFHDEGSPELACWAWTRVRDILEGKAKRVAAAMRRAATVAGLSRDTRKPVDTCADYLLKYAPYLHYDRYLAAGYPIATGVIEGACRYLVRDRMELTGGRGRLVGADAVLKLRALRASGDFDAYWDFHEAREYERNHARRYPDGDSTAGQRAAPVALLTPPSPGQVALAMPLAAPPGPLWAADEKEPHPRQIRRHLLERRRERAAVRCPRHLLHPNSAATARYPPRGIPQPHRYPTTRQNCSPSGGMDGVVTHNRDPGRAAGLLPIARWGLQCTGFDRTGTRRIRDSRHGGLPRPDSAERFSITLGLLYGDAKRKGGRMSVTCRSPRPSGGATSGNFRWRRADTAAKSSDTPSAW